jgi:DMSO/TMAO reductase YedYZ molybdopterin-dependent catalytic subunit
MGAQARSLTMATSVNVARTLETGSILGVLTLVLAGTGLALSPTVLNGLGLYAQPWAANALYVAHLAAAVLLVVFTAWHLWPLAYAFLKKAGQTLGQRASSYALLALVVVEIVTGYELWSHDYVLISKEWNVGIHLATTFLLLTPLAVHASRGFGVWRARRDARASALAAATAAGQGAKAVEQQRGLSRRLFLRLSIYGAAGLALAYSIGTAAKRQLGDWRLNSVGGTPNLTKENYRLRITGLVEKPVEITFADLLAMPAVTQRIVHHCVEGWTYEDEFTGVRLSDVLAKAGGVKPGAKMLVFKSPEVSRQMFAWGQQYTSNFPWKQGVAESALVVYAVHGQDLPREHGFPVRLMTPRKWGFKACKWMTEIEVSADGSYYGYWERAGYNNDGDYPGPIWA